MAPEPRCARASRVAPFAFAALLCATPAHALRIVAYNLLNYPGTTGPTRDPGFRTVVGPIGADLLSAGEMQTQAGVDEFLTSVLNTLEPGQWAAAPFTDGNDTDNALFYKTSRFTYAGGWAFYPNPANQLRLVNVYRLRPVGYTNVEFRVYNLHLKASDGSTERAQRLAEATGLRDSLNAVPPGTHAITMGDFNFYRASDEQAYWKLLESQADNDGRLYDPLNPNQVVQDWHDNTAFVTIHTQSPCLNTTGGPCGPGAATGGMDDRFDFFLPTLNWNDGEGLDLVSGTYLPVGNDGQHLNKNITDAPVIPEGAAYASALKTISDHLPIRVDIQVPAKIAVTGGPLVFPTIILGAMPLPSLDLQVSNPAAAPADELDYSFTGTPGFQVPAGGFSLAAGAPAATHSLRMGSGSSGNKVGTATIASDDPDQPAVVVNLSGTVLRHSEPSLDAATVVVADSVDFGSALPGAFVDQVVSVHNLGYDPLQARLSLDSASLTGGDGRFSIVGGFAPALVAGTSADFTIHFDDAGATADQGYDATLTFASSDEPLPGSVARPALTVALHARPLGAPTATPGSAAPALTRLYAPAPNPLVQETTLRFDLAAASRARLDLFDLSGRRIATLADLDFEAGRYVFRWNGRHETGARADAGVYFARLTVRGLEAQTVRLAVVR